MKVVVTGATGYMGGRLCAALAGAGHDVRAFALPGVDVSGLTRLAGVEVVYGDVTDEESLVAAFHGRDAVFHAAAVVEAWLPDPSVFHAVNVVGLENVLKAAKRTPALKIIYTSSYFAIGPADGYVADETQVHPGKEFCTEYERSKALADRIALQAAADGVPITIVYPGVMYGPGALTVGNLVSRIMIERFNGRLPGYIGNGYDRESFTHVDDVVRGQIAALEKGRAGERVPPHRRERVVRGAFQPGRQDHQHEAPQIPHPPLASRNLRVDLGAGFPAHWEAPVHQLPWSALSETSVGVIV